MGYFYAHQLRYSLLGLHNSFLYVSVCILVLFAGQLGAEEKSSKGSFSSVTERSPGFVRADGRQLLQNGSPISLRSISFANYYQLDLGESGFELASSSHHAEIDFHRVRDLGFNSIRFAINGNWHEKDPEEFWQWLDRNVEWASNSEILLILDLHVPVGGFWLDPNSPNVRFDIWTDEQMREKNITLWRLIADRYRNNPAVAAYDILNEAVTNDSTGNEWKSLAKDIVEAIREVDKDHLIIVGRLYGVDKRYTKPKRGFQFLIDDDNVMYDFHFYEPIEFTHSGASWIRNPLGEGGQYPDYSTIIPTGKQILDEKSRVSSASVAEGDSAWRVYQSDWVKLSNTDVVAALPIMTMRGPASGTVYFDEVRVLEYDSINGQQTQVVYDPLNSEGVWQWWDWEGTRDGDSLTSFKRSDSMGSNDNFSLSIEQNSARAGYWGWSSDRHWFKATPGNWYKIIGKMRGTGIELPANDQSVFVGCQIDFFMNPNDPEKPGFHVRDKQYLEAEFLEFFSFGIEYNVPMSVMEFGTMHPTLASPETGGTRWVTDMLSIFKEYGASFSYWNYHGPSMGLFLSDSGSGPENPNTALIDTLSSSLANWDSTPPRQ